MLLDLSIAEMNEGLVAGKFSSRDLVLESWDRLSSLNKKLNFAITVVDKKDVLKAADKIDANRNTYKSALAGLPYVLKDAYVTKGIRTTSASKVLGDYIPTYSATVVDKLERSGAVLLGKMNMDAWGHGGSSENTDFDPVHNPWDLERSAGGSSGGPAAALAVRACAFAIGEDTGGSIRNPAAWCNISGLKVTYGRVSRYGAIAYASSFDSVGPMAKSVEDCALVLETIAGFDPKDATSSKNEAPVYSKGIGRKLKEVTIGLPKEFFGSGLEGEIKASILKSAEIFKNLGANVKRISFPLFEHGVEIYYLIGTSETSSNLARYDGVRFGKDWNSFSEETKRRVMLGTYALSAGYADKYYKQAQKARTRVVNLYKKAFEQCDAILSPVNPTMPTKLGELISDPLKSYLADIFTVTQNPAGVPSLAIPSGFSKGGLPIGMQLIGPMFSERKLLNIGYMFQQKTDWHKQKPTLRVRK